VQLIMSHSYVFITSSFCKCDFFFLAFEEHLKECCHYIAPDCPLIYVQFNIFQNREL
jgi:hypothetical protein